jgi:histone H3/H4
MLLSERIQQYVQKLPTSLQAEVLNFAEYLAIKAERETIRQEDRDWSSMSLSFAMRGMEDEETPTYTPSDLAVVFS